MMSEFSPERVKGNCAFNALTFSNEVEAWALVDELFDQPGGGQPVDMQIAARHPTARVVLRNIQAPCSCERRFSFPAGALGGADGFLAAFISIEGGGSAFGVKEVVGSNSLEFRMQLVDLSLMPSQSARRQMFASRLFSNCSGQSVKLGRNRRKLFVSC